MTLPNKADLPATAEQRESLGGENTLGLVHEGRYAPNGADHLPKAKHTSVRM